MKKLLSFLTVSIILLAFTFSANAQWNSLVSFTGTNGANPGGTLTTSVTGDTLFGTTISGGLNGGGCIYSVNKNGSNYTDMFDFSNGTGENPFGSLTLSNGVLYGMTEYGGAHSFGNIFSINTNGTGYTDLLDFAYSNGAGPFGGLTLSVTGDTLFGATVSGGLDGNGCIFSITTNGSNYNDILDFNGSNGANPQYGSLILSGGTLYGSTLNGGAFSSGCVFSVNTDGSNYADLQDFSGENGQNGIAQPMLVGNTLFGVTQNGGIAGNGCIYSINKNGSNYRVLFSFNDANGAQPYDQLTAVGGVLYGTASLGGAYNNGTVFSIDTDGTAFTTVFFFNGANGYDPTGGIIVEGTTLYGTIQYFANGGSGYAYSIQDTAVNVFVTNTNENCSASKGIATASISGGTAPYTYLWTPGNQTTATVTGLTKGSYSVAITDNLGRHGLGSTYIYDFPYIFSVYNVGNSSSVQVIEPGDSVSLYSFMNINTTATPTWAPGASVNTNNSFSTYVHPIVTTTYTGTVSTPCGDVTDTVTVFVHCNILLNYNIDPYNCVSSAGEVDIFPTNGVGIYTYSWLPSQGNVSSATGISAGSYTVTVQDGNGCSASMVNIVPSQPPYVVANNYGATTVENGGSGTYIQANVGGNENIISWAWLPSATVGSASSQGTGAYPTATTTYTAAVTTSCGVITDTVTVFVGCTMSVSASNINAYACSGQQGRIDLSVGTGSYPYTFVWSNQQTNGSATGLTAGEYSVTVTDASGCSATRAYTVPTQPLPVVEIGVNSQTVENGGSTIANAFIQNNAYNASAWSWAPSSFATSPSSHYTMLDPTATTLYTVTATTLCGAVTDTVTIFTGCALAIENNINTISYVCNLSPGQIEVSPYNGITPYTYAWSNGQTTQQDTDLAPGYYTVTIQDANGCSVTTNANIYSTGALVIHAYTEEPNDIEQGERVYLNAEINNYITGNVETMWEPSASVQEPYSINSLAQPTGNTTYTLTVNTVCGTVWDTVTVFVNCSLSLNTGNTNVSPYTCSGSLGQIQIQPMGVSPYSYSFSNGVSGANQSYSFSDNDLTAGTYSLTLTDAYGCNATESVNVYDEPIGLGIYAYNNTDIEAGGSTGVYAYDIAGNLNDNWKWTPASTVDNPNANSVTLSPLTTTTYTITDSTQCGYATDTITIFVGCNINLGSYYINPYTCSAAPGYAEVDPSNGIEPYTYLWSNSQTNYNISNVTAGIYTVAVTDASGCTATKTLTVGTATVSIANYYYNDDKALPINNDIERGDSTYLDAQTNAGTFINSWTWSPSSSVTYPHSPYSFVHPTATTVYTLTINTDCGTITDTITVFVNCNIQTNANVEAYMCSASKGSISLSPEFGIAPYTYSWSGNSSNHTSSDNNLAAGTYTVTVSDARGCSASEADVVADYYNATIYTTAGGVQVGNSTALAAYTDSNFILGTWSWAPILSLTSPNTNTTYAYPSVTTTYTVTNTTVCGITTNTITIYVGCNIAIAKDSVFATSGCNGLAAVTPSQGVAPFTYLWSNTSTTDTIKNLCVGTYTCTVTDNVGCKAVTTVDVTSASGIEGITSGASSVKVYPNPNNGMFTLSYSMKQSDNAQISIIDALGQDVYTEQKLTAVGINTEQLNLGTLAAGIYSLRIQTSSGITVRKLVIMK